MVVVHGSAQEKLTAALLAYGIAAVLFKLVDDPINGLRYRLVEMFSGKQSG
jgi:peptidoglycan/LPS O-acetylase OafA/YrhL